MEPSTYQQAIYDWIGGGTGDAVVNAVAGSGKTTTLVQAAQHITATRSRFFAFNKHIADELAGRLTGTTMTASTIHSFGFAAVRAALGRTQIKDQKYRWLSEEWVEENLEPELRIRNEQAVKVIRARVRNLERLCELARLTLTPLDDREALAGLLSEYGVDAESLAGEQKLLDGIAPVVRRGIRQATNGRVIDFADMVFLPVALGLPVEHFDWVLVDEAQDLNACQRTLVLAARAPGGRMIFVGDERQAIYGFAGADTRSYAAIQAATGAVTLPLSICYRCPASHLELARRIVPQIEARPAAPAGTVQTTRSAELPGLVGEGALVVCRLTAPLVSLCIKLIQRRLPARVRGRDIAKSLTNLVRQIGAGADIEEFGSRLGEYEQQQVTKLSQKPDSGPRITMLTDQCAALMVCWTEFQATSIDDLCAQIEAIFSDDRASIWLSTIHRAKGLEADDVTILHPELLPFRHPRTTAAQAVQEHNLLYVALTRAKRSLTLAYGADAIMPADYGAYLDLAVAE